MTGSAQRRIAVPQERTAVEMAPAETRRVARFWDSQTDRVQVWM